MTSGAVSGSGCPPAPGPASAPSPSRRRPCPVPVPSRPLPPRPRGGAVVPPLRRRCRGNFGGVLRGGGAGHGHRPRTEPCGHPAGPLVSDRGESAPQRGTGPSLTSPRSPTGIKPVGANICLKSPKTVRRQRQWGRRGTRGAGCQLAPTYTPKCPNGSSKDLLSPNQSRSPPSATQKSTAQLGCSLGAGAPCVLPWCLCGR